mmetsp:Transcript_35140/g.40078  ORF Transcript_35140/g.40078 Transcript_35140/m.40078 type:complete len:302 (-) Transcript_35140:190-1095(-)
MSDIDLEEIDDCREIFAWPPNRVERGRGNRTIAHIWYGTCFLVFLAATVYTLYAAITAPPITRFEFKKKDFFFPYLTVCGKKFTKRKHNFTKPPFCEVYYGSTYEDDCNAIETSNISDIYGQTPCIEMNGRDIIADEDGYMGLELSISLELGDVLDENTTDLYCSACSKGVTPRIMTLLLSENSLSSDNPGPWVGYSIKPDSVFEAKVNLLELGEPDYEAQYSLTSITQYDLEENVLNVQLSPSETGVQIVTTTKTIAWFELFGSIMGLFGYVTLAFTLCYTQNKKNPYYSSCRCAKSRIE